MADPMGRIYPVLLAGGSGTRLWPVSREMYPKQLVNFIGKDSLVQSTIKRMSPVLPKENVRIVCSGEHLHEIARHMQEIGVPSQGKIICEPCGRNTAPAVLLSVLTLLETEDDAVLCVFPADHVIRDVKNFHGRLKAAIKLARQGYVVTFGIKPGYPETGYGYIEGAQPLSEDALGIKRFVEKPDKQTAQKYLKAGNFFWNSGMFAFKASVMAAEFKTLQPDLYQQMKKLVHENRLNLKTYARLPNISIDYAIMEKTGKGAVLPSDFGWSDIGSWKSLYDFLPKDENGNVIDGDVIAKHTQSSFIMGHDRLIAANRLKDMVVVETPDSIFVSDIDNSRDVKQIVAELKQKGRREYQTHRTAYYPWGSVTVLEKKDGYRVDRIVVYPDAVYEGPSEAATAGQVVLAEGSVRISGGRKTRLLNRGESIAITGHPGLKFENAGPDPALLIYIRIGPR